MSKPKPKSSQRKINKRLETGTSHVGGPATFTPSNPLDISDEEVRRRRAIREDREDIAAAFPNNY